MNENMSNSSDSSEHEVFGSSEERFRRIHKGASGAKGRSIANILYDRSVGGQKAIHGVQPRGINLQQPRPTMTSNSVIAPKKGCDESPVSNNSVLDFPPNQTRTESNKKDTKSVRAHLNSAPCSITNEIRNYGELYAVTKFRTSYLLGGGAQAAESAVSTISVAFSSGGEALASTHGDHTVKITCCHSGRLLQTLEGHPRTPWTVKFHPTNKYIVASGCLGFQVRVWDWGLRTGHCLNMIRLQFAIISLAFHPKGNVLAVASGNSLYLWDYANQQQKSEEDERGNNQYHSRTSIPSQWNSSTGSTLPRMNNSSGSRGRGGILIEMRHAYALRCVHFPPGGNTIIVGGVNSNPDDGTMSVATTFSLKLWDFDISAISRKRMSQRDRSRGEALKNPHTFVNRALLYNDGGFDVSPCGRFLCACAEYWLPHGVECITDLVPLDDCDNEDSDECKDMDQISTGHQSDENNLVDPSDNVGEAKSSETGTDGSSSTVRFRGATATTEDESPSIFTTPPRSNTSNPNHATSSSHSTPSSRNSNESNQMSNTQSANVPSQYPITPPAQTNQTIPLSPPSPPGRRLIGGLNSNRNTDTSMQSEGFNRNRIPPLPPNVSPVVRGSSFVEGRFVPHVVTVSLENHILGTRLEAAPLDGAKASGVTCVKFSPSAEFCLLGYGVRENVSSRIQRQGEISSGEDHNEEPCHPVTALYRIKGGMTHVSTMMSQDDDVNIARFHPHSGHGFVYGTKQGRVRILSPKPWNSDFKNIKNVR